MNHFAKKSVAVFLCIVTIVTVGLPIFAFGVSAGEGYLDPSQSYPMLYENSITYTCQYDEKTSNVLINGTIPHDIMVQYKDYSLEVYAIAPDQTIEDAVFSSNAKIKASMKLAIKFAFSLSAPTMTEKFSRYAIVFQSSEGEKILASKPKYIHVASQYEHDPTDRLPYKGISSDLTSLSGNLGAGTAMIPVYLNRLLGTNSGGMIYPLEDGFCYFDRAYVEALDAKVRTYSASGTRVYFQLLLEAKGSSLAIADGQKHGAAYDFPNLQDSKNLQQIAAATTFLAERYDTYQSGLLSGIVVGSSMDRSSQSYTGGLSLESYAEQYAFYLMVVASSARFYRSEIDIILPFSSMDTYSDPLNSVGETDYSPSLLLETILSILDDRLSDPFSCGTMIESDVVPMNLMNSTEDTIKPSYSTPDGMLSAENLEKYEKYLNQLKENYFSAPKHFIYRWQVPSELSGTRLNCAYAYSYYRLLRHQKLSSFVVSYAQETQMEQLSDMRKLMRYIDTEQGESVTKPLLSYFGAKSWSQLLGSNVLAMAAVRNVHFIQTERLDPDQFYGSFEYFDFSSGNVGDWVSGSDCQKVRADFLGDGVRSVRGVMSKNGSASELLCLYEFSENFIYTPYLKITLELTDAQAARNALYEVTVSMGNDTATILSEKIVRSGERYELWLDLREIPDEQLMTNYIKIGAEMLDGNSNEFSLWVVGVTGYSDEYTSEELAELIEAERLRLRNQNASEENDVGQAELLWIIFVGLFLISSLIIGLILFVKRKDEAESLENDNLSKK